MPPTVVPASSLTQARQLYNLQEIDAALEQVASQLNARFADLPPGESVILFSVLQGGLVTTGHLLPKCNFLIELDYVHATRYRNQTLGSELEWLRHPVNSLKDKTVILVDDIFDEGITLAAIRQYCNEQRAKEVVSVVLLDKQHKRKAADFEPDYVALRIPDKYVFGFGLDYRGHYRNAPGIYTLEQ